MELETRLWGAFGSHLCWFVNGRETEQGRAVGPCPHTRDVGSVGLWQDWLRDVAHRTKRPDGEGARKDGLTVFETDQMRGC